MYLPNSRAILWANISEGLYRPLSIEMMVWRETPIFFASCSWVSPLASFFSSLDPVIQYPSLPFVPPYVKFILHHPKINVKLTFTKNQKERPKGHSYIIVFMKSLFIKPLIPIRFSSAHYFASSFWSIPFPSFFYPHVVPGNLVYDNYFTVHPAEL